MKIKAENPGFIMPHRALASGGYDIFMPEDGEYIPGNKGVGHLQPLGFSAAVPEGHIAVLLPRSGEGVKRLTELGNTCGIIDSDYRGEWKAAIRTKDGTPISWSAGDRLLQFIIHKIETPDLILVNELDDTERGKGGFGHT